MKNGTVIKMPTMYMWPYAHILKNQAINYFKNCVTNDVHTAKPQNKDWNLFVPRGIS